MDRVSIPKSTESIQTSFESPLDAISTILKKVSNVFPYLAEGYYEHPKFNYGKKFSPQPELLDENELEQ